MSDINKGYTFTDKSTDWASNKETAIRLNKMLDDAKVNLVAGANITITPTANGPSISASGSGTGTVTSVNLTAGTSISVSGGPITTSGSITVNNTAPDQVVSLTGAGTTTVTGTYPNFTVSSADSATGTVTSVAATAGTGISVSGSPITTSGTINITNTAPDQTVALTASTGISTSGTYPNFTITNSAPDQTVSLTGAGTTAITGTYPNFTVTSNDAFTGTVTSVAATAGTGITISGSPITSSGTLSITNSAPDQTVTLSGGTGITTSGTYPNFTVTNSAPDQTVGITGGTGITVSGTYPSFTVTNSSPSSGGTVTSVSGAGGTTGLTLTGGPITGSGTLTLGGTLAVANGGTGTASPSLVAGTNVTISGSWPNQTINSTAGGTGTVTSVSVVTANGVSGTVATPTTTPAITLTLGDISAATSKPTGTGSVARTFAARAGDVFNVKDFGATGDGSTNDLPAFNAAATAMLTYGGGCIYMPAPAVSYKLAGVWTITQTTNSQSICLRGDGPGVTKLFFSSASNGVEIIASVAQTEGATTSNVVTVEDFSICSSQEGIYKGLKISGLNVNGSSIGYEIRRISFEGYTVTKYWKDAIHLINCPNAVIKSIRTVSRDNSVANGGDAILLDSTAPEVNRSPTVCDISNVNVQGHAYGIRVIGSNTWEGVTVSESTFVLVNTGIYWNTTTVEEQLNVTNCHIKALASWVNVSNCNRCFITSGNFDKDGSASFTGIDINANSDWATITNNFLRCGSGDVAISMDSDNHTIVGNKMEGQSSGIVLNSGSDRSLVALNQLYNSGGTARAGTCVTDNGANNQVFNNY
jgi:hypothetical protein